MRVDVADANELVLSLAAAVANDGHRVPLLADAHRFAPSDWMWTHLVSVVADAPSPRDASAFLVRLDRMPAVELQRRLVGYYTSWFRDLTPPDVMDRALAGDATAIRAFLRTSMPEDAAWQASLRARLDAGPIRTKRDAVALVSAWHDAVFRPLARTTMRELRQAVRGMRAGASRDAILRAFIGCVPRTDARAMVIVPSLLVGAEIHEFDHAGTLFFCVPVEPRAPRGPSEISAIVRVLADDSRAAIVATLAREDLRAQEVADRVGLGLPTALHHLKALRRAGFVARGGRRRAYALRREPLRRLRALLDDLDAVGSSGT